ncbi:MAG: 16S rRNA (adenine(1518)-N(6)/adenine(1519)-N(6))-dimethyltransferase RsmA [Bacteroidia bacterium]|nr:ribosomal RNA small subunit methyltransferase A [Bacteroidia bacterium]MCZ2276439.1 16S rRNA (adenine(1518)-N(6)/adenine(1519)-N(6))-dimethyltransferase RsmA [Bacteroidia bacterium]
MVKPKKKLGQHFLINTEAANRIVDSLTGHHGYKNLVEIGPGTGALTCLLLNTEFQLTTIEIDEEAAGYLKRYLPEDVELILADVLSTDWSRFGEQFGVLGNLPYNISSQILFMIFDHREQVQECVLMLQKEVAERIASSPGSREYGILSVLLQAFYDVELLFTLPPTDFFPPPDVHSAVIRMRRNKIDKLNCDEKLFVRLVKAGFNQRRKKLRNALKPVIGEQPETDLVLQKRAEQLTWQDFVGLAQRFKK